MFETQFQTAHDVVRHLELKYDTFITLGQNQPFIYPWGTFGAAIAIVYLLFDHRQSPWLMKGRYFVFLFGAAFAIYTIMTWRARNPAAAFGVGLISGWSILWCSVLLLGNGAQIECRRIERREKALDQSTRPQNGEGAASTSATNEANGRHDLQQRINLASVVKNVGSKESATERKGSFAWQSYPTSPFIERLDWVADLFCNFRGMGWNWRISGLPPPPEFVQDDLARNTGEHKSRASTHVSRVGIRRHHTVSALLRENLYIFIRNYIILDVLKTLIAHDAWFWGITEDSTPGYLPASLQNNVAIVQSSRLLICLCAVYVALQFIFSLGPLFFVGILGPKTIGVRGEPWMYPDQFGSYDMVLDKGLAGWWGGWWHQTFRYAFEVHARRLIEALNLDPKSMGGKMIQLVVAFTLSGFLHACGSYTQIGETRPILGPMRFFFLQIIGIMAQMLVSNALKQAGVTQKLPVWVKRTGNFIYVHIWFYYTAPLLVADFAQGGVWLFEPIPISPLRGLGFGSAEDGWFCWTSTVVRWHSGGNWWNSGIAL